MLGSHLYIYAFPHSDNHGSTFRRGRRLVFDSGGLLECQLTLFLSSQNNGYLYVIRT